MIALNLRALTSSLSPLFERIRIELDLSHSTIGLLSTLPALAMGLLPPLGVLAAYRFGANRVVLGGLALIAIAAAARLEGRSTAVLFVTAAAGGVGVAIIQTIMPGIMRRELHERASFVMSLFATTMSLSAGIGASLTPALVSVLGSWPRGLAAWSLPALAAIGLWLVFMHSRKSEPREREVRVSLPWGSSKAWFITLFSTGSFLLFWCMITFVAPLFVERGWSEARAGLILAVISVGQLVGSLTVSAFSTKKRDRRRSMAICLLLCAAGFTGFALAPLSAPWFFAVVLGVGLGSTFPLALMLPVDHGVDHHDVRRLNAMALTVGYSIAAGGPFLLGWARELTGSYALPFLALAGFALALLYPAYRLKSKPGR